MVLCTKMWFVQHSSQVQLQTHGRKKKKFLIEKIVSLKTENQSIIQNLNEKQIELNALIKSNEMLEEHIQRRENEFSMQIRELELAFSKRAEKVDSNLKRENKLLSSQIKQLKSAFADKEANEKNVNQDDSTYEVENILDDRFERAYLIRRKGFDSSHDTWERESNLNCPNILKKYEKAKKHH